MGQGYVRPVSFWPFFLFVVILPLLVLSALYYRFVVVVVHRRAHQLGVERWRASRLLRLAGPFALLLTRTWRPTGQ